MTAKNNIDINELRRKLGSDDLIDHVDIHANVKPTLTELLDRLEVAEKDIALKERVIDSLGAELNAVANERDTLRAELAQLHKEADKFGDGIDWIQRALQAEAKIEAMEKQEPFDADSDVFRIAFEAALNAGNWPATRQGDGYRSPSTQIAWRIAFSTVNRMKLYLARGAQPAPIIPEGWKLVPTAESRHPGIYKMLGALHTVDNTPGASEWESYAAFLAAAPEAKP